MSLTLELWKSGVLFVNKSNTKNYATTEHEAQ